MTHLKPDHWTPASPAPVDCRCGLVALVAATLLLATAASADAGGRVRLSSDLTAHLTSASTADVDVIISGSTESVDRLARRHGLRVRKWLSSGAVLSASKASLEALAQD